MNLKPSTSCWDLQVQCTVPAEIKWEWSFACNEPRRSEQLAGSTNPVQLYTGGIRDRYVVSTERQARTVGISPWSQSRFSNACYRGNRPEALPHEIFMSGRFCEISLLPLQQVWPQLPCCISTRAAVTPSGCRASNGLHSVEVAAGLHKWVTLSHRQKSLCQDCASALWHLELNIHLMSPVPSCSEEFRRLESFAASPRNMFVYHSWASLFL